MENVLVNVSGVIYMRQLSKIYMTQRW